MPMPGTSPPRRERSARDDAPDLFVAVVVRALFDGGALGRRPLNHACELAALLVLDLEAAAPEIDDQPGLVVTVVVFPLRELDAVARGFVRDVDDLFSSRLRPPAPSRFSR
jgi:hypothetical protein